MISTQFWTERFEAKSAVQWPKPYPEQKGLFPLFWTCVNPGTCHIMKFTLLAISTFSPIVLQSWNGTRICMCVYACVWVCTGIVHNELIGGHTNVVDTKFKFIPSTHTHTHTHALSCHLRTMNLRSWKWILPHYQWPVEAVHWTGIHQLVVQG